MVNVLSKFKKQYEQRKTEEMSLAEYLTKAKTDPSFYATPYERLLKAIGPPILVDTSKDERLGRIHGNKLIKTYAPFAEFYGIEPVIEKIVAFLKSASQGLEEANQILYFLGPVGSAKSSLADTLKKLMQQEPIYVLKESPIQESPLGLFSKEDAKDLGIPERYLNIKASPIILKRVIEYGGDLNKFTVQKIYPSEPYQVGIGVAHAGDENTQDISDIVGKINIRKLEFFSADDPDAYSFSGMLCRGHRGIGEFVEMFKAKIDVLNPLLTATQEHNYKGTEAIGAIPFEGIILAHSNESEWELFKTNKANEAFLDRINLIEVPYCLRIDEEIEIYKKLLRNSELADSVCAPGTLQMLAEFSILTRLSYSEESGQITSKLHVYNGEHWKDKDVHAKSLMEYKKEASPEEGFFGVSTRTAFKILSKVFNFDYEEVAANPVHLMLVLEETIGELATSDEDRLYAQGILNEYLAPEYFALVSKDIQTAFLGSYDEYGQSLCDRYLLFADQWVQDKEYRDPQTGQLLNKSILNQELEKIEKPAGISNPKDFRHEVVTYVLRYRSKHGKNPRWTEYNKFKDVIEATMFNKTEDIIPVISFTHHGSEEEEQKHKDFVARMVEKGYTEKQVRLLVEWQMRFSKSKS